MQFNFIWERNLASLTGDISRSRREINSITRKHYCCQCSSAKKREVVQVCGSVVICSEFSGYDTHWQACTQAVSLFLLTKLMFCIMFCILALNSSYFFFFVVHPSSLNSFHVAFKLHSTTVIHWLMLLGNTTGNPGVFQANLDPYPSNPYPTSCG